MSTAASRYAKAMLELAVSNGAVDEYLNELSELSKIWESQSALNTLLQNPKIDTAAKKNVLTAIFSGSVGKNVLHLLLLLVDKGRINLLLEICFLFSALADEYRSILNITITSALPLSKEQADSIGERFKALYRASSVKITALTDKSLIGGVKVMVGDKLYDASVKGQLSKMRSSLGLS